MPETNSRSKILTAYHASDSEVEELLFYNQNQFDCDRITSATFPLEDEPHVAVWREYLAEAQSIGALKSLKKRLVQLRFPVRAGISRNADYRRATRRGSVDENADTTALELTEPEKLRLIIQATAAGAIPVVVASNRQDFVTLIQALTRRNEPQPIPDSMGACIIGGYNNWDRINRYKQQWLDSGADCDAWQTEFKRLIPRKELYQDRLIVLSNGAYSSVEANSLGLSEAKWLKLSQTIRLEHECTHYFTRRVFGSMQNNLLDELIADYQGIVAALGYYRADWFLHFVGLESLPYRQGSRLENYRGDPPLSIGAFEILQQLVRQAAFNLETFDRSYSRDRSRTVEEKVLLLTALSQFTLEELAAESAVSSLQKEVGSKSCSILLQKNVLR